MMIVTQPFMLTMTFVEISFINVGQHKTALKRKHTSGPYFTYLLILK